MDPAGFLFGWWQSGEHSIALSLFIRMLGAVYVLAFLSLLVQAKGLFGKRGILPIRDYLALLRRLGARRFYYCPSLFWLSSGDGAIAAVCLLGLLASALLALGVLPLLFLAVAWLCYLSFKSAGQDFLNFQWDALLLEAGFAAALALASGLGAAGLLLLWFVFFKFMVMAGLAKVLSKDPSWRSLTAMKYHYETQPLPNPLSWFAHNLPLPLHKLSALATFFIEIGTPFLFFGPPDLRLFAFAAQALLQLMILATGNFGALNILTMVMGTPLLPDWLLAPLSSLSIPAPQLLPPIIAVPAVVLLVALNAVQILSLFSRKVPGRSLLRLVEPLEICNSYGLFAVMTTKRYEIILEWSDDGFRWQEYRFRWKPQGLSAMPKECAPHMPRLDWLMWFLPFGTYEDNPWFMRFLEKLLQNSEDVQSLLEGGGPADPPRMVRALAYEYRFTDPKTWKETGRWWERTLVGVYCPPFSMLDL